MGDTLFVEWRLWEPFYQQFGGQSCNAYDAVIDGVDRYFCKLKLNIDTWENFGYVLLSLDVLRVVRTRRHSIQRACLPDSFVSKKQIRNHSECEIS